MNVKNISLKTIDLLNRIKFPVKIFHKIAREKKNKKKQSCSSCICHQKSFVDKGVRV